MICLKNSYYRLKKDKRLANKKYLTQSDILNIKLDFKNWLLGIEEDDPLPFEIKYICLNFNFNNNSLNLSLSGHENFLQKIYDGSYFPLEAQFFNCIMLNSFFNNKNNLNAKGKLKQSVKDVVYKMFYNFLKEFCLLNEFSYLKNKKILIGEFLKEKAYSFTF